jgi:glycosyltransferase involved in cell wall biosynthesis
MEQAVVLTDVARLSYQIIGRLMCLSLQAAGIRAVELPLPQDESQRRTCRIALRGAVVFHNTIGPLLTPVPGVVNVALPLHEWSRYPAAWIERLHRFDAVWTASRFVARTLRASGLRTPLTFVPPALDLEMPTRKRSRRAGQPFRFLSCGEPHFRKAFHLLIEGFLEAFPKPGVATLTIKTSTQCRWDPPRRDIVIRPELLSRAEMLDLYRGFDAYASVSLGEGLGLPVAEATLAGLPVVANRWSGHADLIPPTGCFNVGYRLVDQPFCSEPSYYAAGQRCAWPRPGEIVAALRSAVAASARARFQMAHLARSHLLNTFGTASATRRIRRAWCALPRGDRRRARPAGAPARQLHVPAMKR